MTSRKHVRYFAVADIIMYMNVFLDRPFRVYGWNALYLNGGNTRERSPKIQDVAKIRLFRHIQLAVGLFLASSATIFAQGDETASIPKKKNLFAISTSHFEIAAGVVANVLDTSLGQTSTSMGCLTNGVIGKGVFVEFRQYPLAKSHYLHSGGFIRARLSHMEWGDQQIAGLLSKNERSDVKLSEATIGGGVFFWGFYDDSGRSGGMYFGLDYGIGHWDVKTTYPALANLRFTSDQWDVLIGFEAFSIFLEIGYAGYNVGNHVRFRLSDQDIDHSEYKFNGSGRTQKRYDWRRKETVSTFVRLGYRF